MKNGIHTMAFYPSDYLGSRSRQRSIATGDPVLRLVYLELLINLHDQGGSLPSDADSLQDFLGLPADEIAPRLKVLARLGENGRGGIVIEGKHLRNRRVSEDLERAIAYRELQSNRGKKSGAVRRERRLSAGSGSAEPSSTVAVPVADPNPSKAGAYFDLMSALWPLQPMPSDIGCRRALFEMEATLPPLDEFRAHLESWIRSEQWQAGKIPSPENYIRKGTCRAPDPKRKAVRTGPTIDEGRRTVESDIATAYRAKRITEDERDALIERTRVATSADELRAIAEEVARARVA